MSEQYMYSDFGAYGALNEEKKGESVTQKGKSKTKLLKVLVFLLCGVLLFEAVLYLVIIPTTAQVQVTFTGLKTLQAAELGRVLSLHCGSQWLGFDSAAAASRLASFGAVESVSVEKRFPDQVHVRIKERSPVAVTLGEQGGKMRPVQIDKNGVLFSIQGEMPALSIPLISGLQADSSFDGMRVDSKFRPLLERIAAIQETNPAYFSVISEIKVLPKELGNYELALYPLHSKVRILIDRNLSESALQYMMVVLDLINNIDPDCREVDLRYGSISYRS